MIVNDDTGAAVPANSQPIMGPATVQGDLTVTGSESVGANLAVVGNETIGGALGVTGVSALAAVSATTIAASGAITPSQTTGIVGTTTNNNANTGSVGEYVSVTLASGSAIALTNDTGTNVATASLTAGDWDCDGIIGLIFGATTSYTYVEAGVSTVSATLTQTNLDHLLFTTPAAVPGNTLMQSWPAPTIRLSLAAPTTVYLVVGVGFTVSTMKAYGLLRCRRVR